MDLLWSLSHTISSLLSYFWQVVDKISPFLVLVVAICAIYVAYKSYRITQSIAQENLYYQRLTTYSSPEMGEALEIMWELSKTREEEKGVFLEILKRYYKKVNIHVVDWSVEEVFQKSYHFGLSYKEINQARRQLSYFFMTTFEMFSKSKVLDGASFQKICAYDSFELLYRVVEWFELALNPHYAREKWTGLLEQSGRDDIETLRSRRPPPTWPEVEQMIKPKQK